MNPSGQTQSQQETLQGLLLERNKNFEEIQNLTIQLEKLKAKYHNTIESLQDKEKQIQNNLDQQEEISSLTKQITFIKERYQACQKEIQDYKKETENQVGLLRDLQHRFQENEKKVFSFEQQNYELRRTLDQLEAYKQRSSKSETLCAQYETQLSKTQDELQHQTYLFATLQQKLLEMEQQASIYERENYDFRQQVMLLESYKESSVILQGRLTEYERQLAQAAQDVEEQRALIKDLQCQYENSQKQNSKYEQQHIVYLQKLELLEDQPLLKNEIDSLKTQLRSLFDENKHLNQYLEEYKAQINRDKTKVEKLSNILLEKDQRINELQQLEISLKRATESKQDLEIALEAKTNECSAVISEKHQLENEIKDRTLHMEQLERVIQFLRERSQEAQLELNQLRGEYQSSQENITLLKEQLSIGQSEYAKIDEKNQQLEQEKQEALIQVCTVENQIETLNEVLDSLQQETALAKQKQESLEAESEHKTKKINDLEEILSEKNQLLANFDKEIQLIKHTLVRAVREAKEIESLYQETIQEKINAMAKVHQLQQQIEKHRENENSNKSELNKYKNQLHSAQSGMSRLETLQADLNLKLQQQALNHSSEIETHLTLLSQKDNNIHQLNLQLNHKEEEINSQKVLLSKYQQSLSESEIEVQTAQQHLAKKVKEMALLEEKYLTQGEEINHLHKSQTLDQIKLAELQGSLDVMYQQQQRLELQIQEKSHSYEIQQAKWEEKYLILHEKWQKSEIKIQELEKIEERYHQLQHLMSNFGAIIGSSGSISGNFRGAEQGYREIAAPQVSTVREENPESVKPYQNLFELPKSSSKYKQNLID